MTVSVKETKTVQVNLPLSNCEEFSGTFKKVLFIPDPGDQLISKSKLGKDGFSIVSEIG